MRSLPAHVKFKNILGKSITSTNPMVTTASVYMIRFTKSAVITAAPGMPSLIIKKALAGCPPDADGVIAEKYTSAAE